MAEPYRTSLNFPLPLSPLSPPPPQFETICFPFFAGVFSRMFQQMVSTMPMGSMSSWMGSDWDGYGYDGWDGYGYDEGCGGPGSGSMGSACGGCGCGGTPPGAGQSAPSRPPGEAKMNMYLMMMMTTTTTTVINHQLHHDSHGWCIIITTL